MKPGISRLRAGTDGFVAVEVEGSEHSAKSEQRTIASCSRIEENKAWFKLLKYVFVHFTSPREWAGNLRPAGQIRPMKA